MNPVSNSYIPEFGKIPTVISPIIPPMSGNNLASQLQQPPPLGGVAFHQNNGHNQFGSSSQIGGTHVQGIGNYQYPLVQPNIPMTGPTAFHQHPNVNGNYVFPTRMSNLDFPKFEGDKVKSWLYKCERFFKWDQTPESSKVLVASVSLEGRALQWYQTFEQTMHKFNLPLEWTSFSTAILHRFGKTNEDSMADFKSLKQTGSITEYLERFDDTVYTATLTGAISTEDEIRLFQSQSTPNCPERNSKETKLQHASETIQLQFESLDVASSNTANSFGDESVAMKSADVDVQKKINEQVASIRSSVPRGLVNLDSLPIIFNNLDCNHLDRVVLAASISETDNYRQLWNEVSRNLNDDPMTIASGVTRFRHLDLAFHSKGIECIGKMTGNGYHSCFQLVNVPFHSPRSPFVSPPNREVYKEFEIITFKIWNWFYKEVERFFKGEMKNFLHPGMWIIEWRIAWILEDKDHFKGRQY